MQNTVGKYLLWGAAVTVACFLMWYFSDIVGYILLSAVLAIVVRPLADVLLRIRLRGHALPKWVAAAVSLVAIWSVAVIFFRLFIPMIFGKISEFSNIDIQQLLDAFRQPITALQTFLENSFSVRRSDFSLADSLTRQLNDFLNIATLNSMVSGAVTTVANLAIGLFSVSFITFFFIKEDDLFGNMVVSVFPPRYEDNIRHALSSITLLLKRYFVGLLIESNIIMVIVACALMAWGMSASNAFFIGFLMGILNVIPYIGPLIGAMLSIFIGILDPIAGVSSVNMALIIGGTVMAVKGCDDFILQPLLYSNSVKAHPLEIFLVILIAGSVAGVLGMLLAIPTYNVVRVFAKEFFSRFRLVQKLTDNI